MPLAASRPLDDGGPIQPATGPAPLSLAQERLWFLHQLFPDSAEYNVPVVLRLRGRLDQRALQRALTAVVERHEVLRSHVATLDGRPVLVARSPAPVSVVLHDVNDDTVGRARCSQRSPAAPFDLAAGPAVRADLLRLGAEDHLLALTFHHLVFDGWSVSVLIRELNLCYAARTAGSIPALPTLPIQYGDFAAWQRDPGQRPGPRPAGRVLARPPARRPRTAAARGRCPGRSTVRDPAAASRSCSPTASRRTSCD